MDDKSISIDDLKGLLRARVTEAQSLRVAAKALGISHAYLARLLMTELPPGPKVLAALGYTRVTRYAKQKGK